MVRDLDDNRRELISPQQPQRDLASWMEGSNRERRPSTLSELRSNDPERQVIAAPTVVKVKPPSGQDRTALLHERSHARQLQQGLAPVALQGRWEKGAGWTI